MFLIDMIYFGYTLDKTFSKLEDAVVFATSTGFTCVIRDENGTSVKVVNTI